MTVMTKISIRFFGDREVRAIWDEENSKWWYSVPDIVGVLNGQDDYARNRNYWKYLKAKLKKEGNEVVSGTNQLKLHAPDGKMRLTDVLDAAGVVEMNVAHPFREGNGRTMTKIESREQYEWALGRYAGILAYHRPWFLVFDRSQPMYKMCVLPL